MTSQMLYVQGDLLEATEQYIVQQTNCTACRPHGLSAAIATKWDGADPYSARRRYKQNWAVAADRSEPGTIQLMEPNIICLYGQYSHGKPGVYKDPLGLDVGDSAQDRIKYFMSGLVAIAKLNPTSVAFPYRIGCGLAGGNWKIYEETLRQWAALNPTIRVVIYRND